LRQLPETPSKIYFPKNYQTEISFPIKRQDDDFVAYLQQVEKLSQESKFATFM
jgi:hypothetical protein